MWLQADFARALLLIGLLLGAVALGGEEASRFVADAASAMQAPGTATDDQIVAAAGGNLLVVINCRVAPG